MIQWINKLTSKAKGSYNFYIISQPKIIDTSSTITVTTYASSQVKAMIPCTFRWFLLRNGISSQVYKFKGNTYVLEPFDVGSIIRVQIISNDVEFSGTAFLDFGPVKLDYILKKQIQKALYVGGSTLPVEVIIDTDIMQCQIAVYQNKVQITHAYSDTKFCFDYSLSEPTLQLLPKSNTKIQIIFSNKYYKDLSNFLHGLANVKKSSFNVNSRVLSIKFMNRSSRDIFLLVYKTFYTKRQLNHSAALYKLQNPSFNKGESFDSLLQISILKHDLDQLEIINKRLCKQNEKMNLCINKMDKQAQRTTSFAQGSMKGSQNFDQNESINLNCKLTSNKCLNVDKFEKYQSNRQLYERRQIFSNNAYDKNQIFMKKGEKYQQNSNIGNLLDFSHSCIQNSMNQQGLKNKLQHSERQKESIRMNLEHSCRRIGQLEKLLHERQSTLKNLQNSKNASSLIISYGRSNNGLKESMIDSNNINPSSNMLSLMSELSRIKKYNEYLLNENKQIKQHQQFIINQKINNNNYLQNEIKKLRNELKQQKIKINELENINNNLKNEQNKNKNKIIKLQQQIKQLKLQILNYYNNNNNNDILNRSQHLSFTMQQYNNDRFNMLQQQNQLLVIQNQKLVKCCQQYILDIKQNNKLRKQILELKQQLIKFKHNEIIIIQ